MKHILSFLSAGVVLASVFLVGRCTAPIPETRIDTLIVRDTVRDSIPYPVDRIITRYERDSFPVYLPSDTVERLVFVNIPIEQTTYETDDYKAVIEGYCARLLSMDVYRQTHYTTRTETFKTKPRWGLGVQVGGGYDLKNNNITPYVGIGVQYNIITW